MREPKQPQGEIGTIYLVHFERPFRHARHYLGWTSTTLAERFARHRSLARIRRGSALLRAVLAAGIHFKVVRAWTADRNRERQLKDTHKISDYCPVCCRRIKYREIVCLTMGTSDATR